MESDLESRDAKIIRSCQKRAVWVTREYFERFSRLAIGALPHSRRSAALAGGLLTDKAQYPDITPNAMFATSI